MPPSKVYKCSNDHRTNHQWCWAVMNEGPGQGPRTASLSTEAQTRILGADFTNLTMLVANPVGFYNISSIF